MDNQKEICGTCKWRQRDYKSGDWICTCGDSDYFTDWTDYGFSCDTWEERQ